MNRPSDETTSTSVAQPPALTDKAILRPISILVAVVLLVAASCFMGTNVEQLLLGWLYFPLNTIPKMTADRPSLLVGFISLLLLVVAVHQTARGIRSRRQKSTAVDSQWALSNSILIVLTAMILSGAGTALVGATHQLVWLISGRVSSADSMASVESLGLLGQAKDNARRIQSKNNLKMLALGLHSYHASYGTFPPSGTIGSDGRLLNGWAIPTGPYIAFVAPDNFDFKQSWKAVENAATLKCQMSWFVNPSIEGSLFDEDGFGVSHYAGNVNVMPIRTVDDEEASEPRSFMIERGIAMAEITDGTSNTILLGTVGQNFKPWGHPANVRDPAVGINRSPDGFGGPAQWQGAQFAMCDGSVRFISEHTDPAVLAALGTIAGGESSETIP